MTRAHVLHVGLILRTPVVALLDGRLELERGCSCVHTRNLELRGQSAQLVLLFVQNLVDIIGRDLGFRLM